MIAADFGHRTGQNDEQLVGFIVSVQHGADFGLFEKASVAFFAPEQAVELFLDGRAHQQWVPGVIDAEMDALVSLGAQP